MSFPKFSPGVDLIFRAAFFVFFGNYFRVSFFNLKETGRKYENGSRMDGDKSVNNVKKNYVFREFN